MFYEKVTNIISGMCPTFWHMIKAYQKILKRGDSPFKMQGRYGVFFWFTEQ